MELEIAGFTIIGKCRKLNQDRISANNVIISDGFAFLEKINSTHCFLADGVGGSNAGEVCSQILMQYCNEEFLNTSDLSKENIIKKCKQINAKILNVAKEKEEYFGMASTLAAIIIQNDNHCIFNAGDSPIWVLRGQSFFQISKSHVLEENENNSPITSYFGGKTDNLEIFFANSLREILNNDLFLMCSDGLLKEMSTKEIKNILKQDMPIKDKMKMLCHKSFEKSAEDNISAILIAITK
ncbi:MAG: protein phosphatase 2C domain-containing protein [Ignavibacteria bacterium]|nr:protein phosphatase 2C domain-containing protein [Ignavibacteria bacterium]